MAERMIQIGVTALRDSSGGFLPSMPLFIREEDAGKISPITGRTVQEDFALTDVSKLFAENHKKYVDGTRKLRGKKEKAQKVESPKEPNPIATNHITEEEIKAHIKRLLESEPD